MGEPSSTGDPWWTRPNGWETEGIKTEMRRCGHCKDDITIGFGHDKKRGLCRACLPVFDDHIIREAKRVETERAAALKATTAPAPVKTAPEPQEEHREYRPTMPDFSDMVDDEDRYDDAGNF